MDKTLVATPQASPIVNAVCVAVEDLGTVQTPFGMKPQVKFVFESDAVNDYGEQRCFVRTFNKFFHEKSALSIAVKSWLNRDLAAENEKVGEVDLQSFVDGQARLQLEAIKTSSGKPFDKVVAILPPGAVEVQPTKRNENQD